MTSSIDRLKRPLRFGKDIISRNRFIFFKFRLLVLFFYVNTSGVTCSVSPEHYRKVRKFSMGLKSIRHNFSRVKGRKFSFSRSEYYSFKYLGRYFSFFIFSSHMTLGSDSEKIFLYRFWNQVFFVHSYNSRDIYHLKARNSLSSKMPM